MKSIKFTESILIDQKPEVVFDYTQDYQKRLRWDTFLNQTFHITRTPDVYQP